MAFTLTFPSPGPHPSPDELKGWLTEHGEPYEDESPRVILRAIPVRLVAGPFGLEAGVTPFVDAPLPRVVGLLHDLAMRLGGDIHLVGAGPVSRHDLWLVLADDQDRRRIAEALDGAGSRLDDVLHGLWRLLDALGRHHHRWDLERHHVVQLPDPSEDEPTLSEDETPPAVAVAPGSGLYMLVWRWLSDTFPSLA